MTPPFAGPGVLLIGPYPPPYGGPNVHMAYLQRYVEARGGACVVLNIGPSRRERVEGALPVRSGLDFLVQVTRWARRGYRVHHFFNVESPKAIILACVAAVTTRLCGSRYSVGFIGGPEQRHLQQPLRAWGRLLRWPLGLADFVICNNARVRAALQPFCTARTEIHPIESFHPGQVQHRGRVPPAIESFVQDRRPVLCSVVSPRHETGDPHHEVRLFLEAASRLRDSYPDLAWVVLGGANWVADYRTWALAAELDLHFYFAGEVAHAECLAVMARADAFVRAYVKDGSSSSVREALALRIPTIASRNPQHPRAVIPFEPKDPASLTAALAETLDRLPAVQAALAHAEPPAGGEIERELALLGLGGR